MDHEKRLIEAAWEKRTAINPSSAPDDLRAALDAFSARDRRFGGR